MSSCCTPAAGGIKAEAEGVESYAKLNGTERQQSSELIRHCPACSRKGKGIDTLTVKAMLENSLHAIRPSGYGFCRTKDCEVVYFSLDGEQMLTETDLRVQVHQKHPQGEDVYVCYCFHHTPGTICAELVDTGKSTVVKTVTRGTEAGECACELRNPQGSCCLGNVRSVVKQVTAVIHSLTV